MGPGQLAHRAVGPDDHRRRVARVRPAHLARAGRVAVAGVRDPGHHAGGDGAGPERHHGPVDPGEQVRGTGPGRHGDPAQDRAQLAHGGGRDDVVPDDVADDHDRGAVALDEGVVPVPADLRRLAGGHVPDDDLEPVGLRGLGEQGALQPLGELALLAVEPGVVEREPGAAGDLLGDRDLLGGEGRAVGSGEQGEETDGPAATAQRQHGGGLGREPGDQVAGLG